MALRKPLVLDDTGGYQLLQAGDALAGINAGAAYATTVGDGASTDIVVTHGLGTRNVSVSLYLTASPYTAYAVAWDATSTTTITLHFSPTAPTVGQYTVVVQAGGATGGTGTVTDVSASVPAGFSVVVSTATTTPAIAITTTLSGLVMGTGSGFTVATAGTDYLAPTGDGSGLTGLTGSQISGNIAGNATSITGTIAESQVVNLTTDLAARAPLASPALTGTPTAPTAAVGTNTTQLATTAFVMAAVPTGALLAANNLSDLASASTARTNLGLGSAATHAASDFLTPTGNGSGLTGITTGQVGTSLSGVLKGTGTALAAATEGTDYLSGASSKLTQPFSFGGTGTPTIANDVTPWLRVPFASTCQRLTLTCSTAPTGSFTVVIKRSTDSGSTFPDTIGTITVASGARLATSTTFTNATLAAGDVLRCDVTAVNGAATWAARLDTLSKNQ